MSNHKHTIGPWRIGTPGPNGCYTIGTERGLMTAMVAHSINEPDQAVQALADAKLIASAPDILEALIESRQVIATALKVGAPDWFDTDDKVAQHTTVKKIDAVIAKATA